MHTMAMRNLPINSGLKHCLLLILTGLFSFTDLRADITPPATLQASALDNNRIRITWQDVASNEAGYVVERASASEDYQQIATVGANQTSYTDTGLRTGTLYLYRVRASNGTTYSNMHYAVTNGTTNLNNERPYVVKKIGGTSGNDVIDISQNDNNLQVSINGQVNNYAINFEEIEVKGDAGRDKITVASSVKLRARLYGGSGDDELTYLGSGKAWLVSVGGGSDKVKGNGSNSSYWTDQLGVDEVQASATEQAAYRVHRITSFVSGRSKELNGQRWEVPSVFFRDNTGFPDNSLWGRGPLLFDVQQGRFQNCLVSAELQALAVAQPGLLEEYAVDLGDGTYAVQYNSFDDPRYDRVDLHVDEYNYSEVPSSQNMWWLIVEKVWFAYRRHPQPKAFTSTTLEIEDLTANQAHDLFKQGLQDRKAMSSVSYPHSDENPLVTPSHQYSIVDVYKTSQGSPRFILRNPYGEHFLKNSGPVVPQNGLVTLTYDQLAYYFPDLTYINDYQGWFTPPTPTATNLLENPGFENGLTHWQKKGAYDNFSMASSPVYDGAQAILAAVNDRHQGIRQDITDDLRAQGPGDYYAQAWVQKKFGGTTDYKITVKLRYGGQNYYRGVSVSSSQGQWAKVSGTLNLGWTGTLEQAEFYIESTGDADFYADGAVFRKESDELGRTAATTTAKSLPDEPASFIEETTLRVWPNPSSGTIQVQAPVLDDQRVMMHDLMGRKVREARLHQGRAVIDLSGQSGWYLLRQGAQTRRILIE